MAISRVPGFSLLANLDRQGTDLFISSNGQTLTYFDVNNFRVGINKSNPQHELDIQGNVQISSGDLYTSANTAFDIGTPGNNWRNLYIQSVIGRDVTASGNISAQFFSGNGSQITGITSSYGNSQVGSFLQNYTGVITAGNVTVNGNVTAQYLLGDGSQLSGMYSNVQVATFLPTYTGVVTASNISINGNLTAQYLFGNGSQILGLPATYSNIQVATFLPTYSGVITAGNIYVSGPIISGNITISDTTIASNSQITVSTATSANIILSTSGTGAVQFTGNNAIGLPIGNIANRPTTINAGYLRFNTEFETIEVYDGNEWVQTSGGVITSDVLNGDGSTATFALSANTTTTGVLVSINGTIQKPSTAYTVSNNSITFTEIPVLGDTIEVRKLSGGTVSVNYGNADVAAFLSTYSGLYSNVQATSLITTNGLTNYSNVNASALITTNGLTNYSNVNASALITTNGLTNNSNVNAKAYTETMGFQNYGNVNVAALITTNGLTNYSNVNTSALITTNGLSNYSNVNLAAYLAGNITVGNISGRTNGFTLGYLEMPQVASGNVTLALSDSGKHFYNITATPQTITIPTFANVAFGNGTVVSIVNQSTSNITVALQSGVALYLAGNTTSASRTITSYGLATLLKANTNTWFINGSGVV